MSRALGRPSHSGDRDSSTHARREGHAEIRPVPSDGTGRSTLRILIVEDDPGARYLCDTTPTQGGFTVEAADHARDGLESVRTLLPARVIMGINLPPMGGREAIELIHSYAATEARRDRPPDMTGRLERSLRVQKCLVIKYFLVRGHGERAQQRDRRPIRFRGRTAGRPTGCSVRRARLRRRCGAVPFHLHQVGQHRSN